MQPNNLYRHPDKLFAHEREIFSFLSERRKDLFQADFEALVYDCGARVQALEHGSYLDDGRDIEILAWRILTNPQDFVADHTMRWRGEIIRCGHALVDPAGQIEFRAVARAEKPSGPVRGRLGIAQGRIIERNAAEMGADADENGICGIDRAMPVPSVARLLQDF